MEFPGRGTEERCENSRGQLKKEVEFPGVFQEIQKLMWNFHGSSLILEFQAILHISRGE